MKQLRGLASAGALLAGLAAMSGNALADPVPTPSMAGPLNANPNPFSVDLPTWFGPAAGKVYITGAVSGLAFYQDNPIDAFPGDDASMLDLDNAQVFLQKTDGWLQFFVQVGAYSLPALGASYIKTSFATPFTFGVVPQAFLKLQGGGDWSAFSLEAGKLPTLIGAEYTFTFENMNIERGLLWNQENAVNQGVQANYAAGPLTLSVTLNDGMYSNRFNWVWGLASYAFNPSNTLSFVGGGNLGRTGYGKAGTSVALNNEDIFNVIYTFVSGPWTISPYIQYTNVPATPSVGIAKSASTIGGALLASYSFDDNWKLAARAEYISDSGDAAGAPNLLYGKGSNAWSITVTPTYQWKVFYARLEGSYVGAGSTTPGFALGPIGASTEQTRVMFEAGVLF